MSRAVSCAHTKQMVPPQVFGNLCPPPEHPVKRQVRVRPCPCPWVGPTGTVEQHSPAGTKSRGLSAAPRGRHGTPAEAPAASAPSELRSQQPKVRQLLISPGPRPRQPGPRVGGCAQPPPAVCSLSCLGAATCHQMPAVTNRHHIMLPPCSGCPGDCRVWGVL